MLQVERLRVRFPTKSLDCIYPKTFSNKIIYVKYSNAFIVFIDYLMLVIIRGIFPKVSLSITKWPSHVACIISSPKYIILIFRINRYCEVGAHGIAKSRGSYIF
jgi:hypothetical protein